jgi:nicotinate dehydrogenase subunit A
MMMRAQALLERHPAPSDTQIRDAMAPNLCRCGIQMRILRAVHRAAKTMADAGDHNMREASR